MDHDPEVVPALGRLIADVPARIAAFSEACDRVEAVLDGPALSDCDRRQALEVATEIAATSSRLSNAKSSEGQFLSSLRGQLTSVADGDRYAAQILVIRSESSLLAAVADRARSLISRATASRPPKPGEKAA